MNGKNTTTPDQMTLDIPVVVEKTVNGIEMGVLANGIPYLTQTGLAAAAGISRKQVYEINKEWEETHNRPTTSITKTSKIGFFIDRLHEQGYKEPRLFIDIKDKVQHHAYPDIVCVVFLEYYALEAQQPNKTAWNNFRKLAFYGLREFIYKALRYVPQDPWRYYHDRVSSLHSAVPKDYFGVFHEIQGLIVDLINAGLPVNDKTIPDISVGKTWAKYWKDKNLADQYGATVHYPHCYPDYYPQAASNPQSPRAYPDAALATFRRWFRETYLPTKFPQYILSKADKLTGGKSEANKIVALYDQKRIAHK